jgi:hypothetical protein
VSKCHIDHTFDFPLPKTCNSCPIGHVPFGWHCILFDIDFCDTREIPPEMIDKLNSPFELDTWFKASAFRHPKCKLTAK